MSTYHLPLYQQTCHYQRAGERTQPKLVLVHGYLGGASQWRAEMTRFAENFDVITPNLPGFSDNNHYLAPDRIEGFAQFVLDFLDALGVEHFHLLGHSMGGMIVQEIAKLAPKRLDSLTLYGTGALGAMPRRFETLATSRQRLEQDGTTATAKRIASTWLLHNTRSPAFQSLAQLGACASPQAAKAALTAMEHWDGQAALSQLELACLIIWGDSDRSYHWSQTEQLWRQIPKAQLAVLPGCSHAAHLEKPRLFHALLTDFLGASHP